MRRGKQKNTNMVKGRLLFVTMGGYLVAENMSEQNANCLARLPELYDALKASVEIICGIPGEDACDHCTNASLDLGGPCRIREWRELLRKVSEGK